MPQTIHMGPLSAAVHGLLPYMPIQQAQNHIVSTRQDLSGTRPIEAKSWAVVGLQSSTAQHNTANSKAHPVTVSSQPIKTADQLLHHHRTARVTSPQHELSRLREYQLTNAWVNRCTSRRIHHPAQGCAQHPMWNSLRQLSPWHTNSLRRPARTVVPQCGLWGSQSALRKPVPQPAVSDNVSRHACAPGHTHTATRHAREAVASSCPFAGL
jgi:hypothetical protein